MIEFFTNIFDFLEENVVAIFTAFFLIKGKFVIKLFLRKIILLSAAGLGKRYMVERVLTHNLKVHFLDHLKDDFEKLIRHIKNDFKRFPLVKKAVAAFAFLGSLGFVGKFMGSVLAMKIFAAKIWSFIFALFMKLGSFVLYFLTKVLWGSWLAPLVEIVVFSWLFTLLEKVPFLKMLISKVSKLLKYMFGWTEKLMAKLLQKPLKKFLKWLIKNLKISIYRFIGYERVSLYAKLQVKRELYFNAYEKIFEKRKSRVRVSSHISTVEKLKRKRQRRKPLRRMKIPKL